MSKKITTESFIIAAQKVHGNTYCYNNTDYKKAQLKVVITCKEHGHFEQTPNSHLNGRGCPICGKALNGAHLKSNTQEFIEKANVVHNNKYTYDNTIYSNNSTPVTINCPKHGAFIQTPAVHLRGNGCQQCGVELQYTHRAHNTDRFIKDCRKIHGDKYDYSLVEYVNARTKVKIICPIHGIFEATPWTHKNSEYGCEQCSAHGGFGFSRSVFIKKYSAIPCCLYVIGLKNENESFVKIGITTTSVKDRFPTNLPYTIIPFMSITQSAENVYDLEKYLHKELKSYKHVTKIQFSGYSECFDFRAMLDIQDLLLTNPIIKINEQVG